MERLPRRKQNRLPKYDYALPGCYFITICTTEKQKLFWQDNPDGAVQLTAYGKAVDSCINEITEHYPHIFVDKYVVMPNHVHMILRLTEQSGMRSISTVVQQMKGTAVKRAGIMLWQKSFHDRIIRNEKEYQKIWTYIDNNPAKWQDDCFYC